jgi:signal peptidase I
MYPSLPQGSTFWIRKAPYSDIDDVKRGDIIVFVLIRDEQKFNMVWRVVGVPGDKIEITGKTVRLNGTEVARETVREEDGFEIYRESLESVSYEVAYSKTPPDGSRRKMTAEVPDGELFVLGDNRDNARDSRFDGTVKFRSIIGKRIW